MATDRLTLTEAELLEALNAARPGAGPEEAKTVQELADVHHVSKHTIRRALKQVQTEGRLQVHRVIRTALDGRASSIAGYTITPR